MKNTKLLRIIALMFAVLTCLCFAACGGNDDASAESDGGNTAVGSAGDSSENTSDTTEAGPEGASNGIGDNNKDNIVVVDGDEWEIVE